jgi:hypothetical protein
VFALDREDIAGDFKRELRMVAKELFDELP